MSGAMEKIKAKVENVLHKDKTHDDPTGPHSSHSANQADPRVDSDHIGTAGNHGSAAHGTHGTTGAHGTTGGLTGSGVGSNTYGSDPTGPHDSRLGNKADPRVDSDTYGAAGNHGTATHGTHGTHGAGGLTGSGVGSNTYGSTGHSSGLTGTGHSGSGLTGNTHGTTGGLGGNNYSQGTTGSGLTGNQYGSDPTGPHDSHLANKADPRVDSSIPGPHGNSGAARSGAYGSDPTGPHDSHLGNRADPRVDASTTGGYGNTHSTGGYGAGSNTHSGVGGAGGLGGLSSGPGPAENTAGPHKSDMLNKADPRVDSDLDGSKTYGGNKTSGY